MWVLTRMTRKNLTCDDVHLSTRLGETGGREGQREGVREEESKGGRRKGEERKQNRIYMKCASRHLWNLFTTYSVHVRSHPFLQNDRDGVNIRVIYSHTNSFDSKNTNRTIKKCEIECRYKCFANVFTITFKNSFSWKYLKYNSLALKCCN